MIARSSRVAAPRRGGEAGFTMIELVIGIFVIVLVLGALALMFVKSNDSAFSSQRELSQLSVLQQQMEKIHQTVKAHGFSALALTSAPAAATDTPLPGDPTDPDDFVTGSGCSAGLQVHSNYNSTNETFPASSAVGTSPEPLLVNGCTVSGNSISGGVLAPLQYVDLTSGASSSSPPGSDPYDAVYTFVTQTSTAGCNTTFGSCTGDVRRVILAVLPVRKAADIGAAYPTYSTTVFANPIASNEPGNASGLRVLGLIP